MTKALFREWSDDGELLRKECGKCATVQAAGEFTRNRESKDGRGGRCRRCDTEYARARRSENRAQYREHRRAYYHANKDRNREQMRRRALAYYGKNKERIQQYQRSYRAVNKEKIAETRRAYYAANVGMFRADGHSYRARKRNLECCGLSPAQIEHLYASSCVYCGDQAEHIDHVKPLADGGKHCAVNLVPACAPCNLSKNAKQLSEFLASRIEQGLTTLCDETLTGMFPCTNEPEQHD